jgi:hypothetical protein
MALKAWCRENGVCEQTYCKWQRRLFEMAQAQQTVQFCGRRQGRIKALYWGGNGFVLLYKRLERGSFRWLQIFFSETVAFWCPASYIG